MQNLGLRFTLRQQDSLLSNMDLSNPTFGNTWNNLLQGYLQNYLPDDALNLTASKIQNQVFNQAVLLSNMTIFNALFIIGIMVSVICVFYFPTKKILHKLTLS